ncbi:MAG: hypothetical protein R3E66_04170 [bacterium]
MKTLFLVMLLTWALPAAAQTNSAPPAAETTAPTPASGWSVSVKVEDGLTKAPIADAVVFLRAARPKGPIEPTDPTPTQEWTAISGADGYARFTSIPESLGTSGLRLHAATTWHGMTFKSAAVPRRTSSG